MQEPFKHAFDIAGDVIVCDAANAITHAFKDRRANGIVCDFDVTSVRSAIDFDNQPSLTAYKVAEVGSNGELADEFEPGKPTVAQLLPELFFGTDLSRAQVTGSIGSPRLRTTHEEHTNDLHLLLPLTLALSPRLE